MGQPTGDIFVTHVSQEDRTCLSPFKISRVFRRKSGGIETAWTPETQVTRLGAFTRSYLVLLLWLVTNRLQPDHVSQRFVHRRSLPPTVVAWVELKIGRCWRAWTRTFEQNERSPSMIIKIERIE